MIRNFQMQDIDCVMRLWLDTNISAHHFIESAYWQSNYETVKKSIGSAELYVYEENDTIQGFMGMIEHYIAGIFVSEKMQSKGIGKKLLDYAKAERETLSLHVYQQNESAVRFYLREGFIIAKEQIDINTGQMELQMDWKK